MEETALPCWARPVVGFGFLAFSDVHGKSPFAVQFVAFEQPSRLFGCEPTLLLILFFASRFLAGLFAEGGLFVLIVFLAWRAGRQLAAGHLSFELFEFGLE